MGDGRDKGPSAIGDEGQAAQPSVDDAWTRQCMPDRRTNLHGCICERSCASLKVRGLTFVCRGLAAAAAAKSLLSCPTLCDPLDGSPQGSAVPGILQARTLEWVAISFSNA